MDAVEEITVSKNSVDAENGNSLGGIISLNMKSGTNTLPRLGLHATAAIPSMNSIADPTHRDRARPGHVGAARHQAARCTAARSAAPIKKNRDLQLHVVRAVGRQAPADASSARCRPSSSARGDFSQSVLNGRVRTIYNPFTSTLDARRPRRAARRSPATSFPQAMIDPVALKMLQRHSAAEPAGQHRQLAGQRRTRTPTTGTSRSAST